MRKNLLSLLEISPVQKEVFPSKMMHMSSRILFRLEEDKTSQRNCQNQLSDLSLSHVEQQCQEILIQGKIQSRKFDRRPQIFVKLSVRELPLHKNKLILTNV